MVSFLAFCGHFETFCTCFVFLCSRIVTLCVHFESWKSFCVPWKFFLLLFAFVFCLCFFTYIFTNWSKASFCNLYIFLYKMWINVVLVVIYFFHLMSLDVLSFCGHFESFSTRVSSQ